jgi:hypothetical protein
MTGNITYIDNIPHVDGRKFTCHENIYYKFHGNKLYYTNKWEIHIESICVFIAEDLYFRLHGFNIYKSNNIYHIFTRDKCIFCNKFKLMGDKIVIHDKLYDAQLNYMCDYACDSKTIFWGLNYNFIYVELCENLCNFSKYEIINNYTKKLLVVSRQVELRDNDRQNLYFTNKRKFICIFYIMKKHGIGSHVVNLIVYGLNQFIEN